jgi:hypothetical protein
MVNSRSQTHTSRHGPRPLGAGTHRRAIASSPIVIGRSRHLSADADIFPDPTSEAMAQSWHTGAAKALERHAHRGTAALTARPARSPNVGCLLAWLRARMHSFPWPPEEAQDLRWVLTRAAEPVRQPCVELRRFAHVEHKIAIADDQTDLTGKDVQPFVAVVNSRARLGLRRRDDDLPRLDAARLSGKRKHRATVHTSRLETNPRVTDLGSPDKVIQRYPIGLREREKQLEARPALAGLEP